MIFIGVAIIVIIFIIVLIITCLTYTVTKVVPSVTHAKVINTQSLIPKIIHRTWHSNTINQHMYQDAYASWIKLNPNYTMVWNTLYDCEEFMKKYPKAYTAWKKVIPIAYKSDLWRACKLYDEGG